MDVSSAYEAAYRSGYEAGRAAAFTQLKTDTADSKLTARPSATILADEKTLPAHEPSVDQSAGRTGTAGAMNQPFEDPLAAKKNSPVSALSETTETETPQTPPLPEIASLHMSKSLMPSPLRGSLASLERQNTRLDADGLERILDEADLANRIDHKLLVPLPASAALTVNPNLVENHRYCRPWTARFLADLARSHAAAFHKPIEVNSAVRTVEYQKRLMTTNGNAAAAEGDIVSPHLTGATVDIAKEGLSRPEMNWMRRQLLALQQAGKIDVEEEFEQACFHITVYKSYVPERPFRGAGQPGTSQGAATRHKAAQSPQKRASQPPADLAVGEFPPQGR